MRRFGTEFGGVRRGIGIDQTLTQYSSGSSIKHVNICELGELCELWKPRELVGLFGAMFGGVGLDARSDRLIAMFVSRCRVR